MYASPEQLRELLRKHRPAEIEPLRLVTLVGLKECHLFQRFDALRNDPQLEASGHADHRGHNPRIVPKSGDLTDEGLVDFEGIDRKLSKVAQAGVTRAEIIDRHLYPT